MFSIGHCSSSLEVLNIKDNVIYLAAESDKEKASA